MFKSQKLRNVEKMNDINNGNRSLYESVVSNEVLKALTDWLNNNGSDCVLIGGLALSYYTKPRATMDVDVLYLTKDDIPTEVNGFKRNRNSAFQHNKTHVEIDLVTTQSINRSDEFVKAIFDTSIKIDNIRIASPSGLVALKLKRFQLQDQADIAALIRCSKIDLEPFNLSKELLNNYNKILEILKNE